MAAPYQSPQIKDLGSLADLTLQKPGIFFDFPGAQQGSSTQPPPGTPGTS